MKKDFPEQLMHQPLETLKLSPRLKAVAEMHGLFSLADIARLDTQELEKRTGFSLHLIYEYINFMEVNGLGKYVDPV